MGADPGFCHLIAASTIYINVDEVILFILKSTFPQKPNTLGEFFAFFKNGRETTTIFGKRENVWENGSRFWNFSFGIFFKSAIRILFPQMTLFLVGAELGVFK